MGLDSERKAVRKQRRGASFIIYPGGEERKTVKQIEGENQIPMIDRTPERMSVIQV